MKNITVSIFFLIITLSGLQSVSADEEELKRAIVVFEEGKEDQALAEVDSVVIENYENIDAVSVLASAETLEELNASGNIERVEEDVLVKTNAQMTGWSIPILQTPLSWESGYSGKGVKVAIIDSGITPHQDLKIAGGVSMVDYTKSYADESGHGTHVAGIIGALDNNIGIKGIAPEASLYAVKVFNSENTAYLSDVIRGIDWAITHDMDILNLSLGTMEESSSFKEIIKKAHAQGLLIFAAAGNKGAFDPNGDTVEYPARYSEVIAVSAIDESLKRGPFSSGGPAVDIAAPGVGIYSTYLGNSYTKMSGTSMATPYVAGQAALLKQAYPSLTNVQLRSLLLKNAKDLGVKGKDPIFGEGLLQAKAYTLPEFGKTAILNPAVALESSQVRISGYERTAQNLKATLVLQDSKKVDVTSSAVWSSLNPSIATVAKGKVTLSSKGETKITAVYGDRKSEITVVVEKNNSPFLDVAPDYWAYNEIVEMKEKNIVRGYLDRTFQAEKPIKRGHVAVMLSRTVPMTKMESYKAFPDVPIEYTYYDQIRAVQQAGIFSGNENGFNPNGYLTRAQLAKVMVKAFDLKSSGNHPFTDVGSGHWANGYINVLFQTGITTGSNGKFRPEDKVTRAELAVFISRALKYQSENSAP